MRKILLGSLVCFFGGLSAGWVWAAPPVVKTPGASNLTADDQVSEKGQTDMIANIRSDIVADDSLSTSAHNITIVSQGPAKVVLRGRIPDESERPKIVSIAKKHAKQVVDELVVQKD